MKLATLCYIKNNGKTLMLHRVKKQNDMHEGKWNGLGGKLEAGETPEECVIREIKEESGLVLKNPMLKGLLTFPTFNNNEDWRVFVFVANEFEGELIESNEGNLKWINDNEVLGLNLWEGDRIFLEWLDKEGFFSGKFVYSDGKLIEHNVVFHK
ncbi:MAG: 8-oxo-dGTP diphosphatase [Nanoarchaeota archaeon]|nr:8-oxo-dGTP diphosphatase [Nanoarchaeota archaeon]